MSAEEEGVGGPAVPSAEGRGALLATGVPAGVPTAGEDTAPGLHSETQGQIRNEYQRNSQWQKTARWLAFMAGKGKGKCLPWS